MTAPAAATRDGSFDLSSPPRLLSFQDLLKETFRSAGLTNSTIEFSEEHPRKASVTVKRITLDAGVLERLSAQHLDGKDRYGIELGSANLTIVDPSSRDREASTSKRTEWVFFTSKHPTPTAVLKIVGEIRPAAAGTPMMVVFGLEVSAMHSSLAMKLPENPVAHSRLFHALVRDDRDVPEFAQVLRLCNGIKFEHISAGVIDVRTLFENEYDPPQGEKFPVIISIAKDLSEAGKPRLNPNPYGAPAFVLRGEDELRVRRQWWQSNKDLRTGLQGTKYPIRSRDE